MMGPYSYYCDATFVDDCSAEIHVHDCMWSGECYTCQQSAAANHNGANQITIDSTIPIAVSITASASSAPEAVHCPAAAQDIIVDENEYITIQHAASTHSSTSSSSSSSTATTTSTATMTQVTSTLTVVPTSGPIALSSSSPLSTSPAVSASPVAMSASSSTVSSASSATSSKRQSSRSAAVAAAAAAAAAAATAPATMPATSNDNKKLRHREVEKNRHRQLQAMVKTLSEKIPGRLDKETQVQTMKRAARYCLYLRDVLTTLAHGQPLSGNVLKDRLEKIYLRSSNHVEFIMQQSLSMN